MLEQIKILTSRRAYEFRPDDLRLSTLSIKPMQEQIQQLFQFQAAAMGSPLPTFGEVPVTYPPGFVFNMGMLLSQDEQPVPIRFLHFEQRRIVIDVAGKSAAITTIYEKLQNFLSELRAADGSSIIGEPVSVLDYSEITAYFPSPLDAVFVQPLRKLFTNVTGANVRSKELVLAPALAIQAYPANQEVTSAPMANDIHVFTLALRAGTRPNEHVFFSGAPLDSEAHLAYLIRLDADLTSSWKATKKGG